VPGKGVPDKPSGQGKTEGHLGADARQGCPDGSEGVLQETQEYRRNPGGTLLTWRQYPQAVRIYA